MKYTIWVVSPVGYPHSPGAFQEVADSLNAAFLELHHECSVVTVQPASEENVVILGANLLTHYPPAHWIIYNLEQMTANSSWITNWYIDLLRLHPVWDYSPSNIFELGKLGIHALLLPIGYSPCLTRIPNLEDENWLNDKPLDVLMYGSMNERRQKIFDELKEVCNAHWAFGVYGAKRDELIARAKLVVNIHFYESKVFEIVRCSYLLSNKKCIVSERGLDLELEDKFKDGIVFCDYQDIAKTCRELIDNPEERNEIAQKGFEIFSQMSQAEYLRAVL